MTRTVFDIFTLTLTSKINGTVTSIATTDDIQSTVDIECSLDGIDFVLVQIAVAGMNCDTLQFLHSILDTQLSSPTALAVLAIDGVTLLLSWLPPDDSQCVTGYNIYNNSVLLDTIANITSYTVSNASQNVVYYYNVSAIDKNDNQGQISQQAVINLSGTFACIASPVL